MADAPLVTPDLTTAAESVRDVIEQIDAAHVIFTTLIGKTTARAMREEWPEEAYEAGEDNAQPEVGTAPDALHTQPVVQWNAIQTISNTASVSTASDAVRKYGMDEALSREVMKKLVKSHRDEEFACIGMITEPTADPNYLSTGTNGGLENGANPARMTSVHGLLDAAVRDQSGGAFSEMKIRQLQQYIFENTKERADKTLIVTPADQVIADDMSGKVEVAGTDAGGATRVRTISGNEVNISVQYFQSSFGRVSLVPSAHIKDDSALLFDPAMMDICELEPLQAYPVATDTAKVRKRECFSRSTLRVLNSFSAGTLEGLT
jgi:hypothetical protein